jgi:hypothetical protein
MYACIREGSADASIGCAYPTARPHLHKPTIPPTGQYLEPSWDAFDSTIGSGAGLESAATLVMHYLDQYLPCGLPCDPNLFCLRDHPPGDVRAQVILCVSEGAI